MIARAKVWNKKDLNESKAYILSYLKSHPCADCGESDPVVLEFDHRGDKVFNLGAICSNRYTTKMAMAEIEKCDVRCANCHRRKTYKQFGRTNKG